MSVISIRLADKLLHDLDNSAQILHVPRAKYIREAIEHMNSEVAAGASKQQLIQASLRVRNESMRVNAEFDEIEHDPES